MNFRNPETSFDDFADEYDQLMGDEGDYTHQHTIDPALFKALGNFKGKVVYDVACGNGYISRKLAREGAKEIWASDISEKLISTALSKYENPGKKIKYFVSEATDFSKLPKDYFDLVIMNMAIHYIKDLDGFVKGLSYILKKGGRFVFSTDHPLKKLATMKAKGKDAPALNEALQRAEKYTTFSKEVVYNIWTEKTDLLIYSAPIGYYINILAKYNILTDTIVEPETKTTMDLRDFTPVETTIPLIYALGATKVS